MTAEPTEAVPTPSPAEAAPAKAEPAELTREQRVAAGVEAYKRLKGEAPAAKVDAPDSKADLTPPAEVDSKEIPKHDEADRELALTSLRRAQVVEALKGLGDDNRLKVGRAIAKILGDGDRMGRELAQLKKPPETLKAADSGQAPEEPATQTNLRALAGKLAADLGLEDASAIEQMLGAATGPLAEENARLRKQSQEASGAASASLKHIARSQLRGVFPELDDKDAYAKVQKRMQRLAAPEGAYGEIADPVDAMIECMQDACGLEFREQIDARAKALNAKRDAGQPGSPVRSGEKYAGLSERDKQFESFRLLKTGKHSPAEVKALLG